MKHHINAADVDSSDSLSTHHFPRHVQRGLYEYASLTLIKTLLTSPFWKWQTKSQKAGRLCSSTQEKGVEGRTLTQVAGWVPQASALNLSAVLLGFEAASSISYFPSDIHYLSVVLPSTFMVLILRSVTGTTSFYFRCGQEEPRKIISSLPPSRPEALRPLPADRLHPLLSGACLWLQRKSFSWQFGQGGLWFKWFSSLARTWDAGLWTHSHR